MKNREYRYAKQEALEIQGIGVILCFCCHFLTYFFFNDACRELYTFTGVKIGGYYFELFIQRFAASCRGCFAFSTGYAIFVNVDKYRKISYCVKRALAILLMFWITMAPFYLYLYLKGDVFPDRETFLWNLLALKVGTTDYVNPIFCGYIFFYWSMILIVPIAVRMFGAERERAWRDILVMVILLLVSYGLTRLGIKRWWVYSAALTNWKQLGLVSFAGYMVAKTDLLSRLDGLWSKVTGGWRVTGYLISAFRIFVSGFFVGAIHESLQGITALGIIWWWTQVRADAAEKIHWLCVTFTELGKCSLNMWIISCFLFSPMGFLERYVVIPRNAILVLLWALLICFILSQPFAFAQKGIDKIVLRKDVRS